MAMGWYAKATADNSVALGNGSVADEERTISVGKVGYERKIVNVDDGEVSATSTDAINGRQLWGVQQDVNHLSDRVSDLGDEVDNVGAISAALAGLHPLDYDGTGSKFQLSAAMGAYDGSQAMAIGGFYHFNEDVMLSLSGATAFDGDHKTAGNIGVTFRVGQGGGHKAVTPDVQAKLDAQDEKIAQQDAQLAEQNERIAELTAQVEALLAKDAQ